MVHLLIIGNLSIMLPIKSLISFVVHMTALNVWFVVNLTNSIIPAASVTNNNSIHLHILYKIHQPFIKISSRCLLFLFLSPATFERLFTKYNTHEDSSENARKNTYKNSFPIYTIAAATSKQKKHPSKVRYDVFNDFT